MLEWLFPSRCGACDVIGPSPCTTCRATMHPAGPIPLPDGLAACVALLEYEGAARRLVTGLKYRNRRCSLAWATDALAALAPAGAEVITWAPTSDRRRRARGFDQAELLARGVARSLGRPCRRLLRRRSGDPQTGQRLSVRVGAPAFESTGDAPHAVVVVDDVITTGATISAAALALNGAGARDVSGLVLARTPPPAPMRASRALKKVARPVEDRW